MGILGSTKRFSKIGVTLGYKSSYYISFYSYKCPWVEQMLLDTISPQDITKIISFKIWNQNYAYMGKFRMILTQSKKLSKNLELTLNNSDWYNMFIQVYGKTW